MKFSECINRLETYLSSTDTNPRFVNVQSIKDLIELKSRFHAGDIQFLDIKDYGKADMNPSIDGLFNDLETKNGKIFVVGLTSYLRLKGKEEMRNCLAGLAVASFNAHVVVVCYQCDEFLDFADTRLRRLVYTVESERDPIPQLVFISDGIPVRANESVIEGVDAISHAVESCVTDKIYVKTKREKRAYPQSIFTIISEKSAYDVLLKKDPLTEGLKREYGTEEQWMVALAGVDVYKSLSDFLSNKFGCLCDALCRQVKQWDSFDEEDKWLCFIGLKLFGAKDIWCVEYAVRKAAYYDDLPKYIFNSLIDIDWHMPEFKEKYTIRKKFIKDLNIADDIILNYCNIITKHGRYALYYLTDNSQIEKEKIITVLSEHGLEYKKDELLDALMFTYPDLYKYLKPYDFKNEFVNKYFDDYKYQKVINRVLPEFEETVEEQAEKRDYNILFPPRSEVVAKLEKKNSILYFIDALGVEFLSFIVEKCKEYKLMLNINVCHAELPTITECNKEFIEPFRAAGAAVISIKELDEIKHKGKDNYDYTVTKEPIHLIRELEIVDEAIKRICASLLKGKGDSAVIISDHGASRLAVVRDKEFSIDVNSKGFKNGRVCAYNEDVSKLKYAAIAGDNDEYYVLANYERFKGGRKASVETHGGATLEEVTVPVIVITYAGGNITVENLTSKIKVGRNTEPEFTIFISKKLTDISVIVHGKNFDKRYDAEPLKDNKYKVSLKDIKRKGKYTFDVYSGDSIISEGHSFEAVSAGMSENSIL